MSRNEANLPTLQSAIDDWKGAIKERQAELIAEVTKFTPEEIAAIRALPKSEKQDIVVDLLMAGVGRKRVEDMLGMPHGTIGKWVYNETATMTQKFHDTMSRRALLEFPDTFRTLADLRFHPNAETSRKAALDMARAAGRGIDAPAPAGNLTVNMNGKNNQFNLSTRELEEKITEIAEALGPAAKTLVAGELNVKPVGFNATRRPDPARRDPFEAPPGETPTDR